MPEKRSLFHKGREDNSYRIYKPDGEFVVVEAENAAEAMEKSGIGNAVRIVFGEHDDDLNVLPKSMLAPEE